MAARPRPRRLLLTTLAASSAVLGLAAPAGAAQPPIPNSIASIGDSITRGFNACGWYVDCTRRSWSTGDDTTVNSHRLRILAKNPKLTQHNDAVSGAKVADLDGQVEDAVSQKVDYVTILIGANDVCTSTEAAMTSVSDYESQFRASMKALHSGLPNVAVLVSSIPDIKRLWAAGKGSSTARTAWNQFKVCQSMLASPTSTSDADEARRNRVRQRVIDFNAVLARVCGEYALCKFDGNAIFRYQFTLSQVSRWDYFHPNINGQQVLAAETYKAGFGW